MASVQELQKRIDNKTFDPSTLSQEQRLAVDSAFEQGILSGYRSVADIEAERGAAAVRIARQKSQRAEPFTTATAGMIPFTDKGVERSDLELVGDAGGGLFAYMQDRNKLVDAFLKDPASRLPNTPSTSTLAAGKTNNFYKSLTKIAGGRFKLLTRTAGAVGKIADFMNDMVRRGPVKALGAAGEQLQGTLSRGGAQLLATEAKSQLYSAGGAGAGSISYDMANLATDFAGAAQRDLGEISDNEINKLPLVERTTVHAIEAMKNAIMFNSIASGLGPLLGMTGRGMKGILGVKGKDAETLARNAQQNKIGISLTALADESTFFGSFVSKFFKTLGVFPGPSYFRGKNRALIEKQQFRAMLDAIESGAPLEHASMLGYEALPTLRKNFEEMMNSISVRYDNVLAQADVIGNPKIIPTVASSKAGKQLYESIAMMYPGAASFAENKSLKDLTEMTDPIIGLATILKNFDSPYSATEFITPKEYMGIQKMITRALQNTKIDDMRNMIFDLRKGLKEDFNTVANPMNTAAYLNNAEFKTKYQTLVDTEGQAAADLFAQRTAKELNNFGKMLTNANQYFTTVVQPFNSPIANRIKRTDSQIFTVKGLMGISQGEKINPNEMWKQTFEQVFRSNNPQAIEELKTIIGYYNKQNKTGKQVFDRMRSRYLWDSFLQSYDSIPVRGQQSFYDVMEKARNTPGVIRMKYADDIYDEGITRQMYEGKAIDPDAAMKAGVALEDVAELRRIGNGVGEFNIKKFRQNLGLTDAKGVETRGAARDKLIALYGGGKQGADAADNLLKLTDIIEREFETPIADVSTFLQRRFILGGVGAVAGGFLAGASMGLPGIIGFALLGTYGGKLLSDPNMVKALFDLYSTEERFAKLGRKMAYDQVSPKSAPGLFRLLNWAKDEDKDFPKINPKKIDFDEITEYLVNRTPKMDRFKFNPETDIAPQYKKRFYPEAQTIERSSEVDLAAGENFLRGTDKTIDEFKVASVAQQDPAEEAQAGVQPIQGIQGVQPIQPPSPITPTKVAALFPNDPLFQAYAERQNRG